ncbi:MAG: peptidylprolyl isomerase [Polyangiales bacterium]
MLLSLAAAPGPGHAEVLERVAASVNDEAILLSELRQRAAPYLSALMAIEAKRQRLSKLRKLYQNLLTELIDAVLIRQAARRMQVQVTAADMQRAIDNVRAQNRLSEDQFWQVVRDQGFSVASYRKDLHQQILRLKVINKRVRDRVRITETDIRQRYDNMARASNRRLRFRASHLLFPLSEDASATEVARTRTQAQAVRARLRDAQSFAAMLTQHEGGELGWLERGDLPTALERALLVLSPGEFSPPVRGPRGFHILWLQERERGQAGAGVAPFAEMRQRIYQQMLEAAIARQEKIFIRELRRSANIKRRL